MRMVAAARYADQYDGFLAGAPGFNLPLAAIANIPAGQSYADRRHQPRPTRRPASRPPSATLVANAVLAKCDALDGASDGLVQDTEACQAAFDLQRDVPTCTGARDGTCLSAAQKIGIAQRSSPARPRATAHSLCELPYDPGIARPAGPILEFTAPPALRRRRGRRHLAGAAGEPGDVRHGRPSRSAATSTRCCAQDPRHQRDLHRERRCRS